MKTCKECENYKTESCVGKATRKQMIEDYDVDCFQTKEDRILCEMLCGGTEREE